MKKIFIVLFVFCSFLYSNSLNLTSKDIISLKKIKSLAKSQTDDIQMQYTLMAIVIKESNLGKEQINRKSKDYGPFQANIKTILSRQKVEDTKENRLYFAKKLLNDVGFATANAIIELNYWKKVHRNNWPKIWASYNTGFKYESNTGVKYASSIFEIIKKLKFEYNL